MKPSRALTCCRCVCDNGSSGDTKRILRGSQGDRSQERPIAKLRGEHQRKCLQDQSPVKRVTDMAKTIAHQEINGFPGQAHGKQEFSGKRKKWSLLRDDTNIIRFLCIATPILLGAYCDADCTCLRTTSPICPQTRQLTENYLQAWADKCFCRIAPEPS